MDSAPVKANASLDCVCQKPAGPLHTPKLTEEEQSPPTTNALAVVIRSAPAHQLRYEAARQAKRQQYSRVPGAHHPKTRLLSNKTHYRPTDPEARISPKPGKARAVNTAHGVISHVQADLADSRDSLYVPSLVEHLQTRLRHNYLSLRDLVADTGYSNSFEYTFLEQRGIMPWIPVFGAYKTRRSRFHLSDPDR